MVLPRQQAHPQPQSQPSPQPQPRLQVQLQPVPLTGISFTPASGGIAFLHPIAGQRYFGTLSENRMTGRFNNAYYWSARRCAGWAGA